MADDRYRTCKACMLEGGIEGCLSRPPWRPLPTPLLSPLAGNVGRRKGNGVSVASVIDENGERINNIMTNLAAPPFNKKLRGM